MKKRLFLGIIIIVILVVGFLVVMWDTTPDNANKLNGIPTHDIPTTTIPMELYTDEGNGFTIQYPQGWEVVDMGETTDTHILIFGGENQDTPLISVSSKQGDVNEEDVMTESFWEGFQKGFTKEFEGQGLEYEVRGARTVTVDDHVVRIFEVRITAEGRSIEDGSMVLFVLVRLGDGKAFTVQSLALEEEWEVYKEHLEQSVLSFEII